MCLTNGRARISFASKVDRDDKERPWSDADPRRFDPSYGPVVLVGCGGRLGARFCAMADRFDVVAVGIEDESAVVG